MTDLQMTVTFPQQLGPRDVTVRIEGDVVATFGYQDLPSLVLDIEAWLLPAGFRMTTELIALTDYWAPTQTYVGFVQAEEVSR